MNFEDYHWAKRRTDHAPEEPPHPGDFIRTEIIEAAGLTVTAAAMGLRVSRPTWSGVLKGNANLSGDMALRIEKAFGVKMDTLMRMHSSYDLAQRRKREGQISVPRISLSAATHEPGLLYGKSSRTRDMALTNPADNRSIRAAEPF